jgi:hypothetical protein
MPSFKPRICPFALEQMKMRVTGRPYDLVRAEENLLWASSSDCPGLGLKPGVPQKTRPEKEAGQKLQGPLAEPRFQ